MTVFASDSTLGEARGFDRVGAHDEFRRVLRVLRSRDYRLFWSGSFIANLGVWMQQIALGWLVY